MTLQQVKQEYFKKSEALSLSLRCPLLNRCERRAETICLANELELKQAAVLVGLSKPTITCAGESPYKIGGENNFVMGGMCPEVNLFEGTQALSGFSGLPVLKGEYDKYFSGAKHRVSETGHYSQCAEFALHQSNSDSNDLSESKTAWLRLNYQWLVGTGIAFLSLVVAIVYSN